jgi:hypothetical protein
MGSSAPLKNAEELVAVLVVAVQDYQKKHSIPENEGVIFENVSDNIADFGGAKKSGAPEPQEMSERKQSAKTILQSAHPISMAASSGTTHIPVFSCQPVCFQETTQRCAFFPPHCTGTNLLAPTASCRPPRSSLVPLSARAGPRFVLSLPAPGHASP